MKMPAPHGQILDGPTTFTRRALAKQQTRKRLIGAARQLFTERGYDAATVRDIAAAADLSTGAVFASFADKAELFSEVIFDGYEKLSETLRETKAENSCRANVIKLFDLAYATNMDELQLVQSAIGFYWLCDPATERRGREGQEMVQRQLDDILRRGVDSGELAPGTDVRLTSDLLWAGYVANYRQAIFDGWDVDALRLRFSAQIDIVLAGVRAGSQPN
jgi:AcrR family transcriptional regulator